MMTSPRLLVLALLPSLARAAQFQGSTPAAAGGAAAHAGNGSSPLAGGAGFLAKQPSFVSELGSSAGSGDSQNRGSGGPAHASGEQEGSQPAEAGMVVPEGAQVSGTVAKPSSQVQYLIASFPGIKTIAYTMLPDSVWRPLFIGNVTKPMGVTLDNERGRLYVADQERKKIFWYQLEIRWDGFLKTSGVQHVAVEEVMAHWMAVNGLGDLYFTGELLYKPSTSSFQSQRALFRMDNAKLSAGDALNPTLVYYRANSGWPDSHAWIPSGVAVDSFNIYWGNAQQGKKRGAIVSGSRQNIGLSPGELEVNIISQANNEVRGIALTEMDVFYITPDAIYGVDKTAFGTAELNPKVNVIQKLSPEPEWSWDPVAMAFDGEDTMYWTDVKSGTVFWFPCMDTNPHPTQKFTEAPGVYGIAVYSLVDVPRTRLVGLNGMLKPVEGLQVSSKSSAQSGGRAAQRPHGFLAALLIAAVAFVVC